ncbi:MAG: helix-turn-helix transcriptional regulator [Epulopiscium sp. Nele67-Bin002]|nr:MAG: helix-turn-helix transcriptional regulator [Epulopiscium sp. Nele67-Bin002]
MRQNENNDVLDFFTEMSDYQVSAKEFFTDTLLKLLEKHFELSKTIIFYFDTCGNFLSWKDKYSILVNSSSHPYHNFVDTDIVRHIIYRDALRDGLSYFNVIPRIYKSTDIISSIDYNNSTYVRFLHDVIDAHYSVTMAFGINAYIQLSIYKTLEEGDFTEEELRFLNNVYIYIANFYKNYKKYEQANIVSALQSNIITLGYQAYIIIDDFLHILGYNQIAYYYLKDVLGCFITSKFNQDTAYKWIILIFDNAQEIDENIRITTIGEYKFKIHSYDQIYSNGIIDKYYWITISKLECVAKAISINTKDLLTPTERKVAELIYKGLTYKDIADELVVSYHTIKRHIQNIYIKCEVNSRFELSKWLEKNR